MIWSSAQIKGFAREVRALWGAGWPYFTSDIRAAIVDAKVLAVICGLDRETLPTRAVDDLRNNLRAELLTDHEIHCVKE